MLQKLIMSVALVMFIGDQVMHAQWQDSSPSSLKETSQKQENIDQILKQVSLLWKQDKLYEAKRLLDSAINIYPEDLNISANHIFGIIYLNDATTKSEKIYQKARHLSEKLITAYPNQSLAYICNIASIANLFETADALQSIAYVAEIKESFEEARSLNNASPQQMSMAYFVFGIVVTEVSKTGWVIRLAAGLTWADIQYALKLFEKGLSLNGQSSFGCYEYSQTLKHADKHYQSLVYLKKAIDKPIQIPPDQLRKKLAVKHWTKLKKQKK